MNKNDNIKATAGCLAIILAPLLVAIAILPGAFVWAWTWSLCYKLLVQPSLLELGFNSVDVSYWIWLVTYISIGVFKGPYATIKNKSEEWSVIFSGLGTRILNGLFLALIVWMVSIVVF